MIKLKYAIVSISELTQAMINMSTTDSLETLRISNDENLTIFAFNPDNVNAQAIFMDYPWYTQAQILKELEDDNWNEV